MCDYNCWECSDADCPRCEELEDYQDKESVTNEAILWWAAYGHGLARDLAASAWYCADAVHSDAVCELAGYMSEETAQPKELYLNPSVDWISIAEHYITYFYGEED